uniref:Divergent protein kinase domain 1C n=1 Tax=Lates calcarifer TaxID=8187 RepID=A0A4W6CU70_LATCA
CVWGRGGRLCLLRWLGLRLWSRRGTLLFALLWFGSWLFLNGLVLVHRTIMSDYCTDDKSKRILQRLCLEFGEGSVTGDMCEDLCVHGLVEYKRCLYYENGKKVIEARWRGTPSSSSPNWRTSPPTTEELSPLSGQTLGKETENRDKGYSRAELASLWSLLQQEEYTFLRVLQDLSTHVAKVLGSCGHFYAVEYLSAGHAWDQNIFSWRRWLSRGCRMVHRIALSFLDMVWHFDNDFTHKLHLCDIKPENFAIRKDLTVNVLSAESRRCDLLLGGRRSLCICCQHKHTHTHLCTFQKQPKYCVALSHPHSASAANTHTHTHTSLFTFQTT